jgi:hypothetical protein
MPRRSLSQRSFFDPEFVMPACLEPGTVPWLLARYRSRLFPDWLVRGWRGEGRLGRNAWPAVSLMTLLLLRWSEEGTSRLGASKRAAVDVAWRAAMGLDLRAPTPSEKTLREFEAFLRTPHPACGIARYLLLHENIVRLFLDRTTPTAAIWTTDSTPMWCYGAVKDTVRLLGDGTRTLVQCWAKASRRAIDDVAAEWQVFYVLGKSTKGALGIDWQDQEARANALDTLAQGALRAVRFVRSHLHEVGRSKHKRLLRDCRILARVIRGDLETDAAGRLVVAKRVAKDRIISLTDPQARHGRKSKSGTFNGFKLHLLGDVVSGLIASLTVTRGNAHDNTVAHRLIRRAARLCADLDRVLGDTAYGAAELHCRVREQSGVSILSPPPPDPNTTSFGRGSIAIDFAANTATCCAGVTTDIHQRVWSNDHQRHTSAFRWPSKVCHACKWHAPCCGKRRGGKYIRLHPFEHDLRRLRDDWQRPEVRDAYRDRSQCERLVNQMTRHGARRARAWGIQAAHFQAHLVAMSCNLRLLARSLARSPD